MKIEPLAGRHDPARIEQTYRAGYWRDELIIDLLAKHAGERPDALAIVDGDRRLTWFEFHLLSQRFALHLRELGVGAHASPAQRVRWHLIGSGGAAQPEVDATWMQRLQRTELLRNN